MEGTQKTTKGMSELMHSLAEDDKKTIENGKIIMTCLDQGIKSFTPDLMFEKFVDNYKLAKQIYGESLVSYLSGYDSRYIEKNIKIPEFQREMQKKIKEKIIDLKADGFIDKNQTISEKGIDLAGLVLYTEEIDNLMPKGILGEKFHKKSYIYGDKTDVKIFKKTDRYRDLALRTSIKTSIRRGHNNLMVEDLKSFSRESKGQIYLVYALDSSGSMKGDKISMCKKAGVALAFKAIEEKDKVGLIVFGKEVKQLVMPTDDFMMLLRGITSISAASETNLVSTIKTSIEMFPALDVTKHLIILTDALPTIGEDSKKDPEEETINAVNLAVSNGITISVIGINLDKKGEKLAKQIVELGKGKLYIVKDAKNVDKIILEDYYSI